MSGSVSPLITPEALRAQLDTPDLRLLDARVGNDAAAHYAAGHLRGALLVSLDRDLAEASPHPERGGRHPLPEPARFAALLATWGIAPATHVVIYDDQGGANAAARAWWLLRAIGHANVQILDGGLAAARAAGLPMETAVSVIAPVAPYPVRHWQLTTVGIDEVDAARGDATRLVLDARSPVRYRGESEPFDPVAGHIPGARNAPFADNLDASGRFKSPAELRALYGRLLGDVAPTEVIVHCGSGVTACHDLVALELAGLPGAALYVGSWSEWCRQPARPVGRGDGRT